MNTKIGHSGLGNRAIAERVAEIPQKTNLTKDDTVLIQWTSSFKT